MKVVREYTYRNLETGLVRKFCRKPFYGKWELVSVRILQTIKEHPPFFNIYVVHQNPVGESA